MVRYLFYTIGDLTDQSPLVIYVVYFIEDAYRILIWHRYSACSYKEIRVYKSCVTTYPLVWRQCPRQATVCIAFLLRNETFHSDTSSREQQTNLFHYLDRMNNKPKKKNLVLCTYTQIKKIYQYLQDFLQMTQP